MAQSKSFFDDVKKEVECPVCKEQFSETKEPKILKCLHTFCKLCLERWLRQQGGGALSCPNCRQITECSDNNISSLPSNLFYKQMADIVEAYSGLQGQENLPHCGNCDERRSMKYYCSNCNCFLCEDCAGLHKKWKDFGGHRVKEIRTFESSDVQDYARRAVNVCDQHNDELRYYCEQCTACLCRDCAFLEHRGGDHNVISIEKGIDKMKTEIETKLNDVQVNGLRLRNHKEDMEERRQKVTNSIDEATNEVHRATEQSILFIRQHEASVIEKLTKDKAAIRDAFAIQLSGLERKQAEIESSVTFSKEILDRRNLPEILNVKEMIEHRLQDLSTPLEFMPTLDYSQVKYIPNDVSFLRDAPGKLATSKTEPSLSLAEGKGLTEGLQDEDCTFTVVTKDAGGRTTHSEIDKVDVEIKSESQGNHDIIPAIIDSKNGRYTICYRPSSTGEFTLSVKVTGTSILGSPFKLTVKRGSISKQKSRQSLANSYVYAQRRTSGASGSGADLVARSSPDGLKRTKNEKESCPICLESLANPRTLSCKHVFCDECLKKALAVTCKCPVCYKPQEVVQGNQPPGEMNSRFDRFQSVPGYEGYGTIIIVYNFPSGIQGQDHPNPGLRFRCARYIAYLPDTQEGRKVLQLLKRAFNARLVFTVGRNSNQIKWNGIHHKTCIKEGLPGTGYPDPGYLRRVKEKLAEKGIR